VRRIWGHLRTSNSSDWIVDGKILASRYPGSTDAIAELASAGIHLCVNLHRTPLDADNLREHGLTELHLPVRDFTAPPDQVLARAVAAIDASLAAGQNVAVSCGGGLGRTGTVVAAWLVKQGLSADDAIQLVRQRRPGSIETRAQVRAVHRFAEACEVEQHQHGDDLN